ncbi:MAG: TolB family protein, partial [Planctomycetota bacterium]
MRHTASLFLAVYLATITVAQTHPEQTHPFSVHTLSRTDLEANRRRTDLWLTGTDGTALRRLTSHPENDSNPRWAPDSKSVWFLSKRSESSQIWRIQIDGGEAQQFTDLPLDLGNLVVSPDGEHLAFTVEVFPDCNTISCTKQRLDAIKERKATGRLYERIFVRHWDTWKDGRRSHLF